MDKFGELLPGVEFEESAEMFEARTGVLETLAQKEQNPDLLRFVWTEYAKICEQAVDTRSQIDPHTRAQLQVATLVHKALIFRESGNLQRYGQELSDAEDYAYNMHFNEISEAIGRELDSLANKIQ